MKESITITREDFKKAFDACLENIYEASMSAGNPSAGVRLGLVASIVRVDMESTLFGEEKPKREKATDGTSDSRKLKFGED